MCEQQNQSWLDMLDSSNSSIEDIKNISKGKETREFKIQIFDSKNEKKFDKLVNEKKLKSPFKRRHSNDKLNNDDEENTEKKMKPDNDDIDQKNSRGLKQKFRNDSTSTSDSSSNYSSNCNLASLRQKEIETDQATLDRRQKQIDYGKNTVGYENYIRKVPKDERKQGDPKTPPRHLKYSRRAWEGLIKSWRKKLHSYDDEAEDE
ncbi:hypothetical protein PVAND_002702 [Polypedilum vanderplanki]|uniref:Histone RNA hairpin-binding protein RNA-binding domain-containing protein n=1 Tax=Polypedilum vanderplanki TaxID=319348 RepID=A0A9J6BS68_POLVA|nr:hypothetical protein PVAND_002702 [Polypedilum vanderplanki]